MKEVNLKRVAGPFRQIPFNNYIQSPIGLVPKAGGDQTRLIFHLSYNFKDGFKSLNHHTPKEKCTVKYKDLDHAVRAYLHMCDELVHSQTDYGEEKMDSIYVPNLQGKADDGKRQKLIKSWKQRFLPNHMKKPIIFRGKSDIKSAFCILRLAKRCWKWLVMKVQDPISNVWFYFIDKCLPFGSSIMSWGKLLDLLSFCFFHFIRLVH